MLDIIETPSYLKRAERVLTPKQRQEIADVLVADPRCGAVIRGTHGCRKMRYASVPHKGKSGGARVIYFYLEVRGRIYLLDFYEKSDKEDLSERDCRGLSEMVRILRGDGHG